MELTPEFIQEQKEKLHKKQSSFRKALARLKKEEPFLQESEEIGGRDADDYIDDAVEGIEQEAIQLNEDELVMALEQIEKALKQIDNGTYGTDESTGETISLERLKVYPEATTAVD